jgi:argininosuccinate lyase
VVLQAEVERRVSETSGSDVTGSQPLWAGRFSTPPAPEAHALGRSLAFDRTLVTQDVEAGRAHVRALQDAGLLSSTDADALAEALSEVGKELADEAYVFHDADEDVHSAVERAVTDRLGELGAKLHAGRSRNDLVVTDLRLWLLSAGGRIDSAVTALTDALLSRAREHSHTVMPGTTHGRFAQPVTLAHHLLAHAWALARDLDRLDGWADRTSTSALGAGAIATSTLGLDPDATARRLGMQRAFGNSIDAVSDRDFVQEFLADAAICATHVSRLAADIARWTDESLAWAEMDEAYSTGSSMMPQKRNPDTVELARGKAARAAAGFAQLSSVLQGLPSGYHRDLQEDKEPAFDAVATLELVLAAMTGVLSTMRFDVEAMRAACASPGLYATDVAEGLVKGGVPFREAHRRTGELLKRLESEDRAVDALTPEEWRTFGLPDGAALFDPDRSIAARTMAGGPSVESVALQLQALERFLSGRRGR